VEKEGHRLGLALLGLDLKRAFDVVTHQLCHAWPSALCGLHIWWHENGNCGHGHLADTFRSFRPQKGITLASRQFKNREVGMGLSVRLVFWF
jgi:hypothetical protein